VSQTIEVQQVQDALRAFFRGLDAGDQATIRQAWHPDAALFLHNAVLKTKPLAFLLNLPEHMDFSIQAIQHVDVQGFVASARVDYHLAVGLHSGFFNLVKADGQWVIANWVDHGVEPSPTG
jgi:hypothetical protein